MKSIKEIYENSQLSAVGTVDEYMGQLVYPNRPEKPKTPPSGAASSEVIEYAHKLQKWEADMDDFKQEMEGYKYQRMEMEESAAKFLLSESGWSSVDQDRANKAWAYAWRAGHSCGYNDIFNILCETYDYFA
jgi:hypothetical protein